MRLFFLVVLALTTLATSSCGESVLPIALARDRSMETRDVKTGTGTSATEGSRITVHYEARFPDGKVFMSTRKDGNTHSWKIGDGTVVLGMDQAVRGMRRGGIRVARIPPEMHWGNGGYGGVIPPDTWIEFTIEMVSIR